MHRENTLNMRTFGCFSLTYNDASLLKPSRKSDSQFHLLMQILLHRKEEGISREELEAVLFQNRELNNSAHTLQSVLYNARKRLKESHLPEGEYIIQKNGIYYWNNEIAVAEDAHLFEEGVRKAIALQDMDLLRQTLFLYQGDFLPEANEHSWVLKERWRYRRLFSDAVCVLLEDYRLREEYKEIRSLGEYAVSVDPLESWEELIMEALVALGQYEDARELYMKTSELYVKKQEVLPPKRLSKLLDEMGRQIQYPERMVEEVHEELQKDVSGDEGGYESTYPSFVGAYKAIYHIMERSGESACLMLCTIVNSKGNRMDDTPKLAELSERLNNVIRTTIRKGDIYAKLGKTQYILLLCNTTRENCLKIQKRIDDNFVINRQRIRVQYKVKDIFAKEENTER